MLTYGCRWRLCKSRFGWITVCILKNPSQNVLIYLHKPRLAYRRDMGGNELHGRRVKPTYNLRSVFCSLMICLRGYIASCRDIVGTAKYIARAIDDNVPELSILGSPPASVIAFKSRDARVNILAVGDRMSKKGWHLNALQNPPGLHIACTVS
jgi:hypothetical protein